MKRSGRACPNCSGTSKAPRKKPAALVLAEHPTVIGSDGKLPLIVYQFVGSGKSMFHAFDDTWRWRFRAGDKYFGRFWVQTIRFLARSRLAGQRQAEVQTDRRRYQRGQPIQFRVRFPNPGLAPTSGDLAIQVKKSGQGPRKLTLKLAPGTRNVFEGALPQAAEGDYEVRLLPPPILDPIPTANFRVEAPVNEFERIEMNEPELIRSAESTGGKFYTPLTADALFKDLPKPSKVPLDTDPPDPALEHLAHPDALPAAAHDGVGFQETPTNGIRLVRTRCRTAISGCRVRSDLAVILHASRGRLVHMASGPGGFDDSGSVGITNRRASVPRSGGYWRCTGSPGCSV